MPKLRYYLSLTFILVSGCTISPPEKTQESTVKDDSIAQQPVTPAPTDKVKPTPPPKKEKVIEYKKTYHENGKLAYIITYQDNVKISKQVFTYYNSGELSIQETFVDGLKTGLVKHYSKDGSVWRTEEYRKGKKHGLSTSYYEKDLIAKKLRFKNGLSEGDQETFSRDGKLSDKWIYKQNQLIAHYKFQYFENGNLQLQQSYRDGKKNGLSNEFDENGSLLSSINYKDNVVHGKELQFYESGQIKVEKHHINNKQHGDSRGYFETGLLQWQSNYINGQREGLYKEYYQNGQLKKQIDYKNDLQNGKKLFFHENGKIKYQLTMRDSKAEGLFQEFDNDGNLVLTQHYINGAITKENSSFMNGYLLWLSENNVDKLIN